VAGWPALLGRARSEDINLAEGETSFGHAPSNTARLFDSARDGTAQMVSGKHALVVRQGDGHYALSDVGSTHGTTVNGRTATKQDAVLETAADCGRGHGGGGDGNRRGRGGGGSGRGGGGSGRGGGGWRGRGGSGRGRGAGLTSTGHIAPNSGIAKTSARGQRRRRQ
jgi:hypothetical protein